jgi:chaperone modulatory protein CbpM
MRERISRRRNEMTTPSEDVAWLYRERRVSLVELVEVSGLPEDVLNELVDYGALRPAAGDAPPVFDGDCVTRLRAAARLRNDLELETPALALALSFLERIQSLESEVRRLEARFARPHP